MARVVVVHGIGQQHEGPHTLHQRLYPALRQGVAYAGMDIAADEVAFAGYGNLFRPPAEVLGPEEYYGAADVGEYESALLDVLWRRAAAVDARVIDPDEEVLARSPHWVQRGLTALNRSRFFSGLAERLLIGDLRQVRRYLTDLDLRARIQAEVGAVITGDTAVVVGHSLGSVVAYEALCAAAWPQVRALVTLGSPLGLRHLIFDRLTPQPRLDGGELRGIWPGDGRSWTNIADSGDVVAAVADLRPLFGPELSQIQVHNGAHAHDMSPYLTDAAAGRAIAAGLG